MKTPKRTGSTYDPPGLESSIYHPHNHEYTVYTRALGTGPLQLPALSLWLPGFPAEQQTQHGHSETHVPYQDVHKGSKQTLTDSRTEALQGFVIIQFKSKGIAH